MLGTLAVACSGGKAGAGAGAGAGASADAGGDAGGDAGADASADAGAGVDAGVDADAGGGGDGAAAAIEAGVAGCATDSYGESTELRCTGLYVDWPSRTIAPGVTEYDPGLHLWSDGADKTRWVYLPPGQTIDTSNMDEWTFPVGTRFWKQFVVGGVLVETRLIHKTAPYDWYLTTYRWSADQSSTTELTSGALDVNDAGYEIPSQAECNQCHEGRYDYVLGFEAVSLSSRDAGGLPMGTLVARGLLSDPPDAALVIPGTPAEAAALAYLHTNCGVACHNADNGAAVDTGFFMRLDVSGLGSVASTDTYRTGWNRPTLSFHAVPDRIAQCDPAASCVYYRMTRRDGLEGVEAGTQMPPIDTHMVDLSGVALVAAWINEACDGGTED